MYNLKAVGSDPEFFLADKKNKPIPAIGVIGGSKYEPRHINDDGFSAVQEDNVMVEFNIRPATTVEEFIQHHAVVMAYLDKWITERKLVPLIQPHAIFTKKQLRHKQAKEIGCGIDFNAWTHEPNVPCTAEKLGNIRVAGGHLHLSYTFGNREPGEYDRLEVVRMMDLATAVPALFIDADTVRRKFYGKAGCYRPKEYGVEYRTLSNFWLRDPKLMEWVFNQVLWAFHKLRNVQKIDYTDEREVQEVINTNNKPLAKQLIEKYRIPMPEGVVI